MTIHKSSRYFLFWLICAILIIYGSLLPFELRPHTLAAAIDKFRHIPYLDLGVVSRADWIANILLYIPLGYLGVMWLGRLRWLPRILAIAITAVLGVALAVGVEFTQIFFAPRTVSLNDLIAETIGTGLGLGLWVASHTRLAGLASAVLRPGPGALTAGLTLYALAYLGLALFPYDFILSVSDLQWKLLEGNYGWGFADCGSVIRCSSQWLVEAAGALPLGMLLIRLRHGTGNLATIFLLAAGIGAGIEAAQFMIASGVTTVSGALGKAIGISLGVRLREPPSPQLAQRHARWLRPALLLTLIPYFGLAALLNKWGNNNWGDMTTAQNNLDALHYLPFYYHYFTTETRAVASLMAQASIYLPLGIGFWLWHASGPTPLRRPPLTGLLLTTAAFAFVIESGKLFSTVSHPDPTNILIALGAAWMGQRICQWLAECVRAPIKDTTHVPPRSIQIPRKALIGLGLVILTLGGFGMTLMQESADSEVVFMTGIKHEYPSPASLPPAKLPGFRSTHPRLPAPTATQIVRLQNENPKFFATQRKRAGGGKGHLGSAILMAYAEPGSQDMDALFKKLMALKFDWSGTDQGKLLAQGYDWLYEYWDDSQRHQLQDKLVHGCNYLIQAIRNGKFSPYNVTLYEGTAQALTACSIALYRDDPRGDEVMAFSSDLWKNHILPVWRQVMGHNGGWHEGADVVAKGIGQAIYQLPNMWRRATGEDYFKTEPGIRGFLDFLIYRVRPDGSQMHLGDSASFHRDAPDRLALALEYRNAAAYSLEKPPARPVPTTWPWGPLTDNSLYDPAAIRALPLTKLFDGIGLVVMRSSWDDDATYITFKAGDNYSSFTHLDQGSFTIYKDGALAIDSGLYYKYGSNHHLNYAYQTIAHNVATITNPNENAAISNNEFTRTTRPIANDGGQRRIGGDIELYPNPLDVNEWQSKREIYHTGKITDIKEQNGVVMISADITAAYTNKFSGEGTLSSRTRRVERYLRTFIYDRINDMVLVYDDITKTDPTFTSRWLIHFQAEPMLTGLDRFLVSLPADDKSGKPGGILEGRVLLPQQAQITTVGGKGKEFWVDGRNYDDGGRIYKQLRGRRKKQAEAGKWRIEISPGVQAVQEDRFLVALAPKRDWSTPPPSVQCSRESGLTKCLVSGSRVVRFDISANGIAMAQ
jgi:VanZ family protein